MAWIYKRGSKWWMGYRNQSGGLVQKSLRTTSKKDAEVELERLRLIQQAHAANALSNDFIAALTGKAAERRKTVAEYLDAWLTNGKEHVTNGTATKYAQLVREFKSHIKADAAPISMQDVTADDVRGFLTEKRKATTHETTKGFRRILSGIFLQAQNEGQITSNPVALAKLPKSLNKETGKRAFTLAEVKQLHDKTDSAFWKWMIRTSFFTGFALGDLITMRRVNVDLKARSISIKRRKTGKAVTVPINAGLAADLKDIWPDKAEDFFWPKEANKYLTTGASSFSQAVYDILAACGLVDARVGPNIGKGGGRSVKRVASGLGFHCLRHTFVTNLKISGTMDSVAKELAGHGSSAISAVYTHLPPATLADAVNRMPDFIEVKAMVTK